MDKRLVYNPNIDLSNYNTYQEPMNNLTPTPVPVSNNLGASNIQQMPSMQQQLPNIQQMQQPMPPQIMPQQYLIPENYNIEKMTSKKSRTKKESKLKEICSTNSLRKILVITVLYVIISHNKTSLLLCNRVPYVCITNALSYNILKGIIMAILLILFWGLI
tara:strand:+ start:8621 stop:9103 length:483 start_codon:yes stop_codon:yes gene_type:complete